MSFNADGTGITSFQGINFTWSLSEDRKALSVDFENGESAIYYVLLLDDEDVWVQEMAIRSIGELEVPSALDPEQRGERQFALLAGSDFPNCYGACRCASDDPPRADREGQRGLPELTRVRKTCSAKSYSTHLKYMRGTKNI